MKGFVALTALALLLYANPASAKPQRAAGGLNGQCPRITPLPPGYKYKAQQSEHITVGPRVGGISLITKKGVPAPSGNCVPILCSNGAAVSKVGLYERNGLIFGSRWYTGHGCGPNDTARRIASFCQRSAGNSSIYFDTGSTCVKVNNATSNEGSVN